MLQAAGWPEAEGTVILVGHRPGLNRLAALLMTGREREWEFKKGGIWWLQNRDEGEPAFLRAVIGPRDL
jgi:phosphohistidine phosphatase